MSESVHPEVYSTTKHGGGVSVSVNSGDCRFAVPPNPGTVRIRVGFTDCGDSSGMLEVPSPRYSYPPSCSDSQSCFCLGESGRLRWTRSYFLWCFQAVGHCIDSLEEPTVHLTGSDYYLIAWGGQAAIVGLEGIARFPA
jgi:hypothetical protein